MGADHPTTIVIPAEAGTQVTSSRRLGLSGSVLAAAWLLRRSRRAGLRQVLTWDCGYAAPTPRMQYTAGSFASIIVEWFAFVLRPERHAVLPLGPMPVSASLVEHTPETVLRYVVEPVGGTAMRVARAARALQHGAVQSYLFYLVLGIAALAAVVVLGGVS